MRVVAITKRITGVLGSDPFEDGATASGGAVAGGGSLATAAATKTTANSLAVESFGGKGAGTSNWVLTWGAGWSGSHYGTTPWDAVVGIAVETTPAAPGVIAGPSISLAASRSLTSWASRSTVLKPAVAGVTPAQVTTGFTNAVDVASGGSVAVIMPASTGPVVAANDFLWSVIEVNDPAATIAAPAGWTERTHIVHAGGVVYLFCKSISASPGASVNFTVSTTSVPTLTTAPAVSTSHSPAHTGDVLTVDSLAVWAANGSAIDNYERKLQRDTGSGWTDVPGGMGGSDSVTNASQAALGTHTVNDADNNASVRYAVRAHNASGWSAWEVSNSVAVLNAPVNVTPPVIAVQGGGAAVTGAILNVSVAGDYGTSVVESLSYQWYRGASPLTGETGVNYTLVVTDEGANIRVQETPKNNGGAQAGTPVLSNTIVPAVTAPISNDSFLNYLSGGPGNTNPALSIGGSRGGTYNGGKNELLGPIIGSVAEDGGVFYLDVFVRNTHSTGTAAALKLFIAQQFAHAGLHVAAAVPVQAKNVSLPVRGSMLDEPPGVTWTTVTDPAAGLAFGDLGPGDFRGVHLRFTVDAGTMLVSETPWAVAVEGSAA